MAGNYLAQILGGPAPQPTGIPAPATYTAAQERAARKAGFPSADAMIQWTRQRNTPTGGTIPRGGPSVAQGVQAASAMHPANILNYILQKWQGAMGGN